jgi:hypothetical protein
MSEQQGQTLDPRDRTGKRRYQETSRPLGHTTYFSSAGDDTSKPGDVGGGVAFEIEHRYMDLLHVSRSNNVATAKFSCPVEEFMPGQKINIVCDTDASYNAEDAIVISDGDDVVTYANTGNDEAEKSVTGFISDEYTQTLYLDLNCALNDTWIHEGYLEWEGCRHDTISMSVVPRVMGITQGTNFNLYGGYLIIPAVPGQGTIDITGDWTDFNGGLIYMPDDDLGNPPTAFWNAEVDVATKKYKNITAAPQGNGRYNMFSVEVEFNKFANRLSLINEGFVMLQSADSSQIGQGMRFKAVARTYMKKPRPWYITVIMTMHRQRTTSI